MPLRKTSASLSSKLREKRRACPQAMVRKQLALSCSSAMNRRQSSAQCDTSTCRSPCATNCRFVMLSRWYVSRARIRSMHSSDTTTMLPRLHPIVSSFRWAAACGSRGAGSFLRAVREFSVISESKRMSGRGKKARKVGSWLSGWFSESCVCWSEKDSSMRLLAASIFRLNSSPFSTSMQYSAESYGHDSTCLIACAFSGGQNHPTSILFRSFFLSSSAAICSPTLDSRVTCTARTRPSAVHLSKKAMLLSISAMNSMVFPKVSSPSSPFCVAQARRWSTSASEEYSLSKLQTRSNSKVSSDHRQMVRSLAAEMMTRSSLEGTILSTCLVWWLQLWIMMHSAEETVESGSRQTLTLPLMSPVMVYLQLLLKCTQVIAVSFLTSLGTAERSSSRGREQKLMPCVPHTYSSPSPRSYPYPLFQLSLFFSSTARSSNRSIPNRTLDRNFVSLRLVLSATFSVSISMTPTSRKSPRDSIYSKPTEYLLSQSLSRPISSRLRLQTQSFQSSQSTISTPSDPTNAQLMIPRPSQGMERDQRCSRCPSKATSGSRRCTTARRTPKRRKVGSTDSYPCASPSPYPRHPSPYPPDPRSRPSRIVTLEQKQTTQTAEAKPNINNQVVRVSDSGRAWEVAVREWVSEGVLGEGDGAMRVWYC